MELTQIERVRAITQGELTGDDAVAALRLAVEEIAVADAANFGYRLLISEAERFLVYGKEGRPGPLQSWS